MLAFPPPLARFWARAEPVLKADDRLLGVMAAGSAIANELDAYSDLDLVLVVEPSHYDEVLSSHVDYPARISGLLAAFVGYHVGEPRLVIALYEQPLVHVDFKFVLPETLKQRIETPVVLLERGRELTARLNEGTATWPNRDPQWFEDRFWTWVHYGGQKIERGELFEAVRFLSDIADTVMGPLIARRKGFNQRRLRRIERIAPELVMRLDATLAPRSEAQLWTALNATIELYCELRKDVPPPKPNVRAESVIRAWVTLHCHQGHA